jgi:MFS family permease
MRKRQLFALFICQLVPFTVGNATIALMPLYVTRFGAEPGLTGSYLASTLFALTMGTLAGGWLSARVQRRREFILGTALLNIPGNLLMGQATELWQLIILTGLVWFLAGIAVSMVSILAGLFAEESERGRVFGVLGIAAGLGGVFGGAGCGFIVTQWGFGTLFLTCAALWIFQPLVVPLLQDKDVVQVRPGELAAGPTRPPLGLAFYMLLVASTIASTSGFIASLGRPLQMNKLGFDSQSIASVVSVAGMIGLPLPFMIGWLSDRFGRYRFLVLCYLSGGFSLLVLAASTALWQFWLAAAIGTIMNAGGVAGQALITDLVPPEGLSVALSRFGATGWIGGMIGLLGAGYAIQTLGMTTTLILSAAVALTSVVLLIQVQRVRRVALAASIPT